MTDPQRVNIGEQHPAAYKALIALSSEVEEAAAAAGLNPLLVELLKIRTSQINGCAFCLRMHTRDALKKGETPDRIAVLPGWEETDYFSETDRAALRLTEAITRVPDGHVSDEDFNAAAAVLTADQVSAIAWLATVMNAFNRVAITSGTPSAADLGGDTDGDTGCRSLHRREGNAGISRAAWGPGSPGRKTNGYR
jgi:alkylhydroperoxidase AhpD family core domain